jgi:WD repeat-containing protein 19
MKQLLEAAQLYEKTGLAEKAASIYINLKMFKQATPLISKIKSPKLLTQLAKVKII